jgi:hypothetical protein
MDVIVILFFTGFVFVGFLATAYRSSDFVLTQELHDQVSSQDKENSLHFVI